MLSPPVFFVISNWLDSGILKVPIANPISPNIPTNIAPKMNDGSIIEKIKYIKYPNIPPYSSIY